MKTIICLVTSCSFPLLVATSASADVMLSNLNESNSLVVEIGNGSSEGAIQFSTGSSASAWDLDAVTLALGGPGLYAGNNPILYSASIYTDAGNVPGSQLGSLGSFNFTDQTSGAVQVTFNPSTTISINASSVYWIIVSAQTVGAAGWLDGTGARLNEISGNGWQYGSYDWFYASGQFLHIPTQGTAFLEIDATAVSVPEPCGNLLAGLGAAISFGFRRHKSQRSSRQAGESE